MHTCKRLYIIVFLFVTLACKQTGNESIDSGSEISEPIPEPVAVDLDTLKKRGKITAIVDNSSTGFFLYKGQPMGYEYDLLARYAEYMDLNLEIKMTESIRDAFVMLNKGEGDVIAYSLTITKKRKEIVEFTDSHYTTRQVLVQRKPDNWRSQTLDQIDDALVRNQVDLIGKEIHIRKNSSYTERLENLSHEIGGDILIIEEDDSAETEELIKGVSTGEFDYTVADESVALVNASYYPNIDVKTPVSFPQQIAWAVRKTSPELRESFNDWMSKIKKEPTFNVIYAKYFKSTRSSLLRAQSDYSSINGDQISPYDSLLKIAADTVGWDWRLLAAQMYQESKFDPNVKSWAGAIGLMQLVPETGQRFGARNLYNPNQNIMAAAKFIHYLDGLWKKTIDDPEERKKFVLASYNVGLGHVTDARDLAIKYDKDPTKWYDNVETYLLFKSKPKYFQDPVVNSGYCRGSEPVQYVKEILSRYNEYVQFMSENS